MAVNYVERTHVVRNARWAMSEASHGYFEGCAMTPYGMVKVTIGYYNPLLKPFSCFSVCHNGRVHHRRYNCTFSSQGALTKARKFAEDVCSKQM